jgi:hypothetical protein
MVGEAVHDPKSPNIAKLSVRCSTGKVQLSRLVARSPRRRWRARLAQLDAERSRRLEVDGERHRLNLFGIDGAAFHFPRELLRFYVAAFV